MTFISRYIDTGFREHNELSEFAINVVQTVTQTIWSSNPSDWSKQFENVTSIKTYYNEILHSLKIYIFIKIILLIFEYIYL